MLGPGRAELDVELRSFAASALERGLRRAERPFGVDAALGKSLALDAKVGLFDVEAREIVADALAARPRRCRSRDAASRRG